MFEEKLFTTKRRTAGCAIRVGFGQGQLLWVKIKTWRTRDPEEPLIKEDEYNLHNGLARLDFMSQDPHEEVDVKMTAANVAKYLREGIVI